MKFTPVLAAGLVAFATAQPARDAQVADTPGAGFLLTADEGCAGFQGNRNCGEYARDCYKDLKKLATEKQAVTKQQVIDCTQGKLKADAQAALGQGGSPIKEQLCAGYLDHPKCREYAQACDRESRGSWTGQQLVDCTQGKLKADAQAALGPGGEPTKEQLCAGYLDHPKCREYAQECYRESRGGWTGQKVVHCTQEKLVGPSVVNELCVRWERREDCIADITDCNTNGQDLTECMSLPDLYSIVEEPKKPAQP